MAFSIRLTTPRARLSHPALDVPRAGPGGGKEKYSAALVFEAGTDLSEMENAVFTVAEERWGKKARTMLQTGQLKSPWRQDWEAKGYPKDSIYINCRTDNKPNCVDFKVDNVPDGEIKKRFYPGAGVLAAVSCYAFDVNGSKGVTFGLNNVQLVDETLPRFDGQRSAKQDFQAVPMKTLDFSDLEAE